MAAYLIRLNKESIKARKLKKAKLKLTGLFCNFGYTLTKLKIYNKTCLFIGFILVAVPNWYPQYQNIYKYLIQLIGIFLMLWAFRKPRNKK